MSKSPDGIEATFEWNSPLGWEHPTVIWDTFRDSASTQVDPSSRLVIVPDQTPIE